MSNKSLCFNRTIVELKQELQKIRINCNKSFNRTIVELKHFNRINKINKIFSF